MSKEKKEPGTSWLHIIIVVVKWCPCRSNLHSRDNPHAIIRSFVFFKLGIVLQAAGPASMTLVMPLPVDGRGRRHSRHRPRQLVISRVAGERRVAGVIVVACQLILLATYFTCVWRQGRWILIPLVSSWVNGWFVCIGHWNWVAQHQPSVHEHAWLGFGRVIICHISASGEHNSAWRYCPCWRTRLLGSCGVSDACGTPWSIRLRVDYSLIKI